MTDERTISTEHQKPGDAGRPLDTLDSDPQTPGGQKPEKVEDRPSVGSVDPDDHLQDAGDR